MRNDNEIRIVLGSKQYAGNTDKDIWIQPSLIGDRREFIEGDRSINVNQQVLFDNERQKSDKFRIAGKITNIFNNTISGKTSYDPFKNDLYYTNGINDATNGASAWEGYPQFNEFTISRNSGINGHTTFVSKSASTYNWSTYITYAFSSTTAQTMSYTNERFGITNYGFKVGDGIPYVIDTSSVNGKKLVYFYCATNHNLKEGMYVNLSVPINGKTTFKVYSLGDGSYGSESNVFSIYDMKFTPSNVQTGTFGNFKKIVNITNSGESMSKYYIRLNKVILTPKDGNIVKGGFENNPFPIKKKLEYSALTPNQTQRVSVKEGSQTYSFTFDKDININGLIDNNGKPISELFFTIIERGYMGWFNKPYVNINGNQIALDIGWKFNILKNTIDNWWDCTSTINKDNIPVESYTVNNQQFYYNGLLNEGDILKGDFCEYNDIEQKEYVLSPMLHKYSFNQGLFYDNSVPNLPSGYAYQPHNPIKIREYSDYIETGSKDLVDNIPGYAWFSEFEETWFWRDLYQYGFIDSEGVGLNIPFINGAHYPFLNLLFLQYPLKRNVGVNTTLIKSLTNDNCE
jgi:hypothetical protein